MTQPDLFPIQESLSPRLRWLRRHGLRTNLDELPRCYIGPNDRPWVCSNLARTVCTFASTEEEAIIAYCERTGIRHWNLEPRIIEDE